VLETEEEQDKVIGAMAEAEAEAEVEFEFTSDGSDDDYH
jgi:hypothetical protein